MSDFMPFSGDAQDVEFHNSRKEQMEWLAGQGFDVVEYRMVTVGNFG